MKTKIIALTTLLILSVTSVKAQGDEKVYKNFVGVDATGLLRSAFIPYPFYTLESPMKVNYRRLIKNGALRVSFGGTKSKIDYVTNDTSKSMNNSSNLNISIGFEHYTAFHKRWSFYSGAEVLGGMSNVTYESNQNPNYYRYYSSETMSFGAGAYAGIIFMINKRISLATETGYTFLLNKTDNLNQNGKNQSPIKTSTNGFNTNYYAPTSISFRIHF